MNLSNTADALPQTSTLPSTSVQGCPPDSAIDVGDGLRNELSDEERERHIRDCVGRMLKAMADWDRWSNPADYADAQHWLRLQNEAIKARSPEQVAKMERERGLGGHGG